MRCFRGVACAPFCGATGSLGVFGPARESAHCARQRRSNKQQPPQEPAAFELSIHQVVYIAYGGIDRSEWPSNDHRPWSLAHCLPCVGFARRLCREMCREMVASFRHAWTCLQNCSGLADGYVASSQPVFIMPSGSFQADLVSRPR